MADDEPIEVARIANIAVRTPGLYAHPSFQPGRFYPLGAGAAGPNSNMPASRVAAVVLRGRTFAVAETDMILCIHDIVKTAPDVLLMIEFGIGGRVGVNQDAAVEIVTDRSVADGDPSFVQRVKHGANRLWQPYGAKQLKQPIEIQTNGGVMGIKG